MTSKLKDASKLLDSAAKDLAKEQLEWKVKKGTLQRESIHLKATNTNFEAKIKTAKVGLDALETDIANATVLKQALDRRNSALELENHKLESGIESTKQELVNLEVELERKKAELDSELEYYGRNKKIEIKDQILDTNAKLTSVKTELAERNSELESKKTELGELNQVYMNEQIEIKQSSQQTKQILAENRQKVSDTKEQIEALEEQVRELEYKKNQAILETAKTKSEHENFLNYEKRARKVLENKDRELQDKSAEISSERVFLKNQRSLLADL